MLHKTILTTGDVGYLCANFSLLRPLCSRHRPDERHWQTRQTDRQTDRQTNVRRASSLNAPTMGRGIIILFTYKATFGEQLLISCTVMRTWKLLRKSF